MKSRTSVLAACITAVLGVSMSLASCSSSSSSDTTVAAKIAPAESSETEAMESDEATESDVDMSNPYCVNAQSLKAVNLKELSSDTAGGAAMALDAVMGEFPEALQESSASMQEFLMEAATSATAKDGSSHQATLTEVLAWFDERC